MQAHPLEQYLAECRIAHSTKHATPETAFYPALANLLNAAGSPRDVRVHCVMGLKDQGAGMPDGGLFTPDQFSKSEGKVKAGQVAGPSRGVIECKPPKKDVLAIADTQQVSDYWNKYNQVLVTNYRELPARRPRPRRHAGRHDYYRLADSEADFWTLANDPAWFK